MGSFINVRLDDNNTNISRNPLLMNEYGHYMQSQRVGILYPFSVIILSEKSALSNEIIPGTDLYRHDIKKFEMSSNRNAARYFGKHY